MVESIKDLVELLVKRDGISENEAWNIVGDCQVEIDYIAQRGGTADEAEYVIKDLLGLEPDYLDLFL